MKSMMIKTCILTMVCTMIAISVHAQGRLIRRIQEKTEQKIVNEIFGEPSQNQNQQQQGADNQGSDDSGGVQNRRGTGLSQEAPDVQKNIREAGDAYQASNYTLAKSSVRNALWGVELEIGKKVLQSLPTAVSGLGYLEREDKVSSAGIGFVGLIIERIYQGKEDMQVKATVGNDSALLGIAGFYMVDGTYMQSTDQPDQKQIQFKEHRAVIRYDDYDGYTLSVPFGQSSVFVVNGVNFESESQFMAAANSFDINTIKKELGEQ
jgi:hypothetical protein